MIYRGHDRSTVVSGLSNGEYRFRVRSASSPEWHDEAVVIVEHHSLARALSFFALGAVVFAVLIAVIAGGRRLS